jgi:hypothetical protein
MASEKNKYSSRPSALTVLKDEIPWDSVGKTFMILVGIVLACVLIFYAGKGIVHLHKTYSYTTSEIESERGPVYTESWNIMREYKPAWTEYYYVSDSEGHRTRKSRHHSAEYYFVYNGRRHSVSHSTYNMSYTTAYQDFQKRVYVRTPNYPDYPNKVDTNPYTSIVSVSSVCYK